ncbi:unnamed protein product [Sphenostylis stenocarpa]|uniref:Transcription factor CBF/NF-Y/archaeal histone domain-containing protein n=1 Tax=Sphenostylis stenocarpa TaxID=92480 RepID=A0AA86T0T9_9FABA|nr:unnamed protein product [Sphenostylis stenocarpa]
MDENKHGEAAEGDANNTPPPPNPPTQTVGRVVPSSSLRIPEEPLEQRLNKFWDKQYQEIEETTNFRNHSLPLARIKRIMKSDEEVKLVAAEAPVVFAKACEMFITELTTRAWVNAEENRRRTLTKADIVSAMSTTDMYDFLIDIVPREDTREHQVHAGIPGTSMFPTPAENVPYYPMPPNQRVADPAGPQYGVPVMLMGNPSLDENHHVPQNHPSPTPMLPNPGGHNNHSPNSDD